MNYTIRKRKIEESPVTKAIGEYLAEVAIEAIKNATRQTINRMAAEIFGATYQWSKGVFKKLAGKLSKKSDVSLIVAKNGNGFSVEGKLAAGVVTKVSDKYEVEVVNNNGVYAIVPVDTEESLEENVWITLAMMAGKLVFAALVEMFVMLGIHAIVKKFGSGGDTKEWKDAVKQIPEDSEMSKDFKKLMHYVSEYVIQFFKMKEEDSEKTKEDSAFDSLASELGFDTTDYGFKPDRKPVSDRILRKYLVFTQKYKNEIPRALAIRLSSVISKIKAKKYPETDSQIQRDLLYVTLVVGFKAGLKQVETELQNYLDARDLKSQEKNGSPVMAELNVQMEEIKNRMMTEKL